ncbi:response regulator [Paenibacillus oralis]|uniref:Response regulator n=1 Tax=Paenibacillus oralis TaxID=2490856 RepID=A0A3P3TYL1_9BACL|nr:response regulator [Paenibacillus oralis]RRJ63197.1 response regulator [Paenibacillus oralis]
MIKLMLVEDEDIIRKGIRDLIGRAAPDFEVVYEAAHGKEALAYLERNVVDAIITDIRMREMDGLQMVEKLRAAGHGMPIVIVSGYGDFVYAKKALQFGIADYLLKPIDRKDFAAALDKIRLTLNPSNGEAGGAAPESQADGGPPSSEGRRIIRKLKNYIAEHPDGDLRLQTLAERVHLNPSYLSQLFKQEEGGNLSDYIAETRIRRACKLLETTKLKVYDIARLSGYQSPKHFMLVFKQHTGMTPGTYRERKGM